MTLQNLVQSSVQLVSEHVCSLYQQEFFLESNCVERQNFSYVNKVQMHVSSGYAHNKCAWPGTLSNPRLDMIVFLLAKSSGNTNPNEEQYIRAHNDHLTSGSPVHRILFLLTDIHTWRTGSELVALCYVMRLVSTLLPLHLPVAQYSEEPITVK